MTKKTQKFTCPKCGKDLRKVGLYCEEYGMTSHHLQYDKSGSYQNSKVWDGNTNYYYVYCGECGVKLDIELGDVWRDLPKKIKLLKDD